jgi:UDP-N-acetylglucosamine 2-epimerase (non-hydrolysing)
MTGSSPVYFVLGTRAQFIKVAPLLRAMLDQAIPYTLIYTAQHRENIDELLNIYRLPAPDVVMYGAGEANTKGSFARWFLAMLVKALFRARQYLPTPGLVLTHGDTFTAWLAALMGRRAGCRVGHIESGCRSYNLFSPFPEEISRLITFRLSDIYFCADEWALNNLKGYRGLKVNVGANTLLDGVRYALRYPDRTHYDFEDRPYVVVSIHRYENIFTSRLTQVILPYLKEIAQKHFLVFTLHPTTRERLRSLGLLDGLRAHPNMTLHERFGFVDWINICSQAAFVITDGGSNQEELSYLGVPTLLFRTETERQEGLGRNVVISKFDPAVIRHFIENPANYRQRPVELTVSPSQAIIAALCQLGVQETQACSAS